MVRTTLFLMMLTAAVSVPAYDFSAVPDMTWVSFGNGPRSAKAEFTTAFDHVNNVWVCGFG